MSARGTVDHVAWIRAVWSEHKGLVALLFFLTLLSSAVAVLYPYLSKLLLDTIQGLLASPGLGNPMDEVDRLLLVFLAVGLAGLVASMFPGIRGMTNSVFEHVIRSKYFRKVLAKDYGFFAKFSTGDVVTRLTDDLYDFPKLSWFLCSGIFRAVESISKVAFCLAAMVLLNPKLTLYSLVPLPLMIAIFYVTQDRIYDTFQKNQEAISAVNARLEMSFSGVRIIKAYACEDKYRRFFRNVLEQRFGTELAVAKLEVVLHLIYQYIDYVAQVGIVFAGGLMAVRGEISIGTFYAFYTYLTLLIFPILDIPQLFVSGKRAFVNIDRLEEIARHPEPAAPGKPRAVDRLERVELYGVSFRYGDRAENSLTDICFSIGRGERIGVIGPVGSGKSTLVKCLLGLLPPSSGEIRVNGEDLRELDLVSYRARVGYVPQEALLFSGSLRENVDFGGESLSDEMFRTSVEAAQMAEEIASFTDGERTVVGQRGVSLSGGQKQRMAIARAVARRPELMLFDDITASLDAANEERLMRRLDELSGDLSFVIVSHRLSTLQYVDKVLFLDQGRALGFGRHEELLQNRRYRAFIEEHLGKSE
ncbi:MAG TPA: ABC transporter ATP-binding protein [Spirochaetia bacterium]|nr:ABC transporter ATP-binding protein [Spirochaetales bacterium]HRZ88660.1 ABC transporter ATP-binding protein [Spirochaetia bacterium]